jgi:hypothetical protein
MSVMNIFKFVLYLILGGLLSIVTLPNNILLYFGIMAVVLLIDVTSMVQGRVHE